MKNFLKQFFDIKFWKFILVGILNTVVGNGLMFVFYNLTPLKNAELGIVDGYWISSALGYIIGSIVSYFLNKHFTFKNTEKGIKPVLKFAVNIAVCYFLAYGLAQPLTEWILSGQSEEIRTNIAMLVGMCLFVAFNYIGQRFFTFREKKESADSDKGE
ncbi:MAG: GtrA family protein [Clostridiales bacterium]|nr:GtrA family protein [Clostridiales bacterium]